MPASIYCHACGAQVRDQAGATVEPRESAERKPITVLFVDAFGSLGLATPIDAERWLALVDRFFSIVSATARRFGGTVDRLTGGGIKLLFGAPLAHESHARQACHAALQLTRELAEFGRSFATTAGADFSVRMGINSGEVVFGRVGADRDLDFTSQGHVAALAARLEELAAPGKIYLTESTAALVAGFFELREVGTLPIRGTSSGVRVYELLRETENRSRLEVLRDRLSPFVGRERELAELERAFHATRPESLTVIGLVGEPGVGKSRLCDELIARLGVRGARLHRVQCFEHGRSIPFHAAQPFFRSRLGVVDDEPPEASRERLELRLRALDPALGSALPSLLEVLGLAKGTALDGSDGRGPVRDLTQTARRIVEAGGPAPSLVVIDDAQWMDAASEAILTAFLEEPARTPTMLVATYRPGLRRPWMSRPEFRELPIAPLAPAAAIELAERLLGDDASLGALARRVAERAGGNPYFVEEIVRALAEQGRLSGRRGAYSAPRGVLDLPVPPTLQAVLAARVDQLPEGDKALLQTAAVIGPEVSVPLLRAVSGLDPEQLAATLASLEEGGFLRAAYEAATYRFHHPLLQETVYRSLLRERRALIHGAVAREAERLRPPGVSGQPSAIAWHYERAGERRAAARWHREAAHAAARRDLATSLEHWRRVYALTEDDADRDAASLRLAACEAMLRLGPYGNLQRDEAIALLVEGRRLAAQLEDTRMTALLISAQGLILGAVGDVAGAIAFNRDAFELAMKIGDERLAVLFAARLALAYRTAGELGRAADITSRILDRADRPRLAPGSPESTTWHQLELVRVATNLDCGELARGTEQLDALLAALRENGDRLTLVWALAANAMVVRFAGDTSPRRVHLVEEGLEIARLLGLPGTQARALTSMCLTRLCERRWAEARDLARAAAECVAGEPRAGYVDMNCPMMLAEAFLGLGEIDAALAQAREAVVLARSGPAKLGQVDAALTLGRVLLEVGAPDTDAEARAVLESGLALALSCSLRSREPHLRAALAVVARRTGDEEQAAALERDALRLWEAMGAHGYAVRFAAGGLRALTGSAG
ncbi:MAG TPA: AAA family ATPase [Candidatus Binatia bacterium]